ncbi:ABC-type antimicrobial peptide transport system permease subunit [Chitinophaga niastensis]|uniref:ABC-type antimicrobial peptide transport system permease subunit n=1 Tax=Chitinophaga niastensis TaxID=536980 RepID=A0A2P8HUJ8_CHINA|nr:ABC transporter permease [Chitinophaga niastensis]PSL49901.1 ABC-type antimicrobial peptide transport system permease subunit [Chitinophaga niastensis]
MNYFKTAWRNLIGGKSFSVINILGLSIGMAGAMLILLWLHNEISFDKFHENKDRLYEVYGLTNNSEGKSFAIPLTEQPLAPALKQNYPEVAAASHVKDVNSFLFTANNASFTGIAGAFVDPSFLQMFSFPLIAGNKNEQLKNVYSITITEKLAKKMFGNEDAIGKIIKIDSIDNFTVTGVLKDLPSDTRFDFEYLLPWDYLKKINWNNDSWLSNNISTFVLLQPGTDLTAFNNKIKDIARLNAGRNDIWTHFLFPLSQWHLYAGFENGKPSGGRIETVRLFGLIAAVILLIACINFMNLSTASSEKRAKEVGIRKVAGAGKGLLIGQFIVESILIACVSGGIALLITQLALPSFGTLINTVLFVPYNSLYFWLSAAGFILFTGLLAGSYPAFYLSSFKPVSIFQKKFKNSQSLIAPRKALVVLQFTFAIILIISTIVVRNQIQYAQDRETGYSKRNLIHVDFVGDIEKNYPLIKQDLINAGVAASVTKTIIGITQGGGHTWGLRWQGESPKDTNVAITFFSADADLVKTTGMQLLDGRDIDINKYPADSFSVVLNETAVKTMGFKKPIGRIITSSGGKLSWHVVGVVKDYIAGSPYGEIPPVVIEGPGSFFNTMHIKFNPAHSTSDNLAKAEQVFKKYNQDYPFNYQFVDQEYAKRFDNEQRTKTLAGLFATLAIFISCLGLFGLSAYMAESRVKEIGVRKVLGASVLNIAKLLSLDFIKLVFVSIVIATPVAWYAMNKWLQDYSYRIHLSWAIFLIAGLLAIAIALITVSFQSIRSAMANPVKSLRKE